MNPLVLGDPEMGNFDMYPSFANVIITPELPYIYIPESQFTYITNN